MSAGAEAALEEQVDAHPMLAELDERQRREVIRKKRTMDAFEAMFELAGKTHGFNRHTLGRRMQMMDIGSGWARFRDRYSKAYITVGMTDRTAVLDGDHWTNALRESFRQEETPEDLAEADAGQMRTRIKQCTWYQRHRQGFPEMYKAHHPGTGSQIRYLPMDEAIGVLLSNDCSQEEADELQAACDAPGQEEPTSCHVIVAAIEDCIADDTADLQVQEFKAHPSFEEAVLVGIEFVRAQEGMERAIAAVRMDRVATEMQSRAFSRDVNPFSVVRDEAAKRLST